MRNTLVGSVLGLVAVAALATPGALYMAAGWRPIVQPTVTVTETVTPPPITQTVTVTERVTEWRTAKPKRVTVTETVYPNPGGGNHVLDLDAFDECEMQQRERAHRHWMTNDALRYPSEEELARRYVRDNCSHLR